MRKDALLGISGKMSDLVLLYFLRRGKSPALELEKYLEEVR